MCIHFIYVLISLLRAMLKEPFGESDIYWIPNKNQDGKIIMIDTCRL